MTLIIGIFVGKKASKKQTQIEEERLKNGERIISDNRDIEERMSAWERAMDRYGKLYYCKRDDVVFIPGEIKSSPVTRMNELLFN